MVIEAIRQSKRTEVFIPLKGKRINVFGIVVLWRNPVFGTFENYQL
jgi:hypothetical protein